MMQTLALMQINLRATKLAKDKCNIWCVIKMWNY